MDFKNQLTKEEKKKRNLKKILIIVGPIIWFLLALLLTIWGYSNIPEKARPNIPITETFLTFIFSLFSVFIFVVGIFILIIGIYSSIVNFIRGKFKAGVGWFLTILGIFLGLLAIFQPGTSSASDCVVCGLGILFIGVIAVLLFLTGIILIRKELKEIIKQIIEQIFKFKIF